MRLMRHGVAVGHHLTPDGGRSSGTMHQAGDYYEAAVDAMDSVTSTWSRCTWTWSSNELVKATAELSKYTM